MTRTSRRAVLRGAGAVGLTGLATAGAGWVASADELAARSRRHDGREGQGGRAAGAGRHGARRPVLDTIVFGDAASEQAHGFRAELATVVAGALGQPARVLEPRSPAEWWGGTMTFTLAVAERGTTHLSVKFFGEEFADADHEWRLQVFLDGEVLGWFDQGAVDNIDQMSQHRRRINGFYLHTLPLPESRTRGRRTLEVEIRALGRIYAYGGPTNFFYPMTTPSRGLYRAYTHTEPYFEPAEDDDFGRSPAPGIRQSTDAELLARIRQRVLDDQNALLYGVNPHGLDAWGYVTLAEGYHWPDSPAYRDPRALSLVCQAIDGRYLAWQRDGTVLTGSDQQWQGFGRVGLALCVLWDDLQSELDSTVTPGPAEVPNPGFEIGLAGWAQAVWRGSGTTAADDQVHRTGRRSARVTANPDSAIGLTINPGRILVGQGPRRYSVWCRTESVTTPGAYLDVIFYNAAGQIVRTDQKFFSPTGTHDWAEISAELATPAGATHVRLDVRVEGSGTAWFDDVAVEPLDGATPPVSPDLPVRRVAYREMLLASREYWGQHQRHYTNQAQICSIGIYQANRGLRLLSPADAWPEKRAREWLYESVGLSPWRGPEREDGSKTWPLGRDYHVVSSKGLTRELGYVGTYGEVTDWLVAMYESVRVGPDGSDDPRLRQQILKIINARSWFRHPAVDDDGNHAMRLEQTIGWRNEHYPGDMVYAQRTAWDGHPVEAAAVLRDARIVGWAQQMVADGQFAPQLDLLVSNTSRRVGLNAFHLVARDLPVFEGLPASPHRLPGGWDRPDFVFTDEVAGAIAVKRGKEILYASLYWRARQGVNDWARVHLLTPHSERSGTIRERSRVDSDEAYTVQDWVTWDYAINDSGQPSTIPPGGWTPPGPALRQAFAGERQPIAPVPADMDPALGGTTVGIEQIEVGRAPCYELAYAGYLVAMNTTRDRTFTYRSGHTGVGVDLVTGKRIRLDRPVRVGPRSTVVWFDPAGRTA